MKVCTEEGKGHTAAYGPRNKAGDENDRIFHVNGKLCHRGCITAALQVRLFQQVAAHESGDGLITEYRCSDYAHHQHYGKSSKSCTCPAEPFLQFIKEPGTAEDAGIGTGNEQYEYNFKHGYQTAAVQNGTKPLTLSLVTENTNFQHFKNGNTLHQPCRQQGTQYAETH